MNKISRRSLGHWAADQLIAGKSASGVAKHLAAVVVQSNMKDQLEFLISDIAWELEERGALAIGKITSAHPLSKQLEAALTKQVKQLTKAQAVVLEKKVDKSVLGGLRVETSNHVWDQTVLRKLSELREVF